MRVPATKLVDSLVLLLTCKTAALLVLRPPHAPAPGFEVAAWYGMAAVYAGCAWVCGVGPRAPGAAELFARAFLLFGVLLSVCLMHQFSQLAQPSPVHPFDWLVLGVCCGCSALLERPSSSK